MDTILEKQLREVIAKNLPEIQANEFKKFIEEANDNKVKVEQLKLDSAAKDVKIAEFNKRESELNTATSKLNEANAKLISAETKERKYELDIRDEKIKQRDYVITQFYGALSLLVKNPRAIEVMNHSINETQQPYYSGSNYVAPPAIYREEAKTTEHKETKEDSNLPS